MDKYYTQLLTQQEGSRRFVYDDATGMAIVPGSTVHGHPTIGIGRALDASHGLSDEEVDYLFAHDIDAIDTWLTAFFPFYHKLTPGRQFALVSMTFNLGRRGLMGFPEMLAAIKQGDYEAAAYHMLDSKAARELPDRYKQLAAIMRSGADGPDSATA